MWLPIKTILEGLQLPVIVFDSSIPKYVKLGVREVETTYLVPIAVIIDVPL